MAYYDRIAKKWHSVTGYHGGAFKKLVLNDRILGKIEGVEGLSILELGAGNGYFLPLLLRRFSGQKPARLVVTDQSGELLELAQRHFKVPEAEYKLLDVRGAFPFPDNTFDLILATMVFNEVSPAGLRKALEECYRTLNENGQLLVTVTHPAFVESLAKRGQLKRLPDGFLTMPGADGLRLPVIPHRVEHYESVIQKAGFQFEKEAVFATPEVLHARPGLREAGNIPIALIVDCRKVSI